MENEIIGQATYSPEDNKLRLYPHKRLDQGAYAIVKEHGFNWAPKQELFVAPSWSPKREDLLIKLCGEIEPEEMTMAERAELKAERLAGYAEKRLNERNAYHRAAASYSERFEFGQPILVGHHSERSARVAQKRADSAMNQAAKREKTANWHLYKAQGALSNANRKNSDRTRSNRIETLLKDYRDKCRTESDYLKSLEMWTQCKGEKEAQILAGSFTYGNSEIYHILKDEPTRWQEIREKRINAYKKALEVDSYLHRIKAHIINRLGYERSLLGPVARYSGDVTPGVVQVFARTWGVNEPKAYIDGEEIGLSAKSALPPFISDNENGVCLAKDAWLSLFQELGYEPPVAIHNKSAVPPLLNVKTDELRSRSKYHKGKIDTLKVVEVTKAQYSKLNTDYKGTELSECGSFRFRVAMDRALFCANNNDYGWSKVAVFLVDQKAHELPKVPA